jgi:hypothetical protein
MPSACHPHAIQRQPGEGHRGVIDAASGKAARRVVANVEFHSGELFPRVGFIATNLETDSRERRNSGSKKASRR